MLKNNKTLATLDIGFFGATGTVSILDETEGVATCFASFLAALADNTALTECKICWSRYSNENNKGECVKALIAILSKNKTLKTLYLPGLRHSKNIQHADATALTEALRNNTTLHELQLTDFSLGTRGVKAIALALENNATLRKFSLIHD